MNLIERLEQAERPSRHLDWDIAVAFGLKNKADRPGMWNGVDQMAFVKGLPRFTASIDAALTLADGMSDAKLWMLWNEALTACGCAERHIVKDLPRFIVIAALKAMTAHHETENDNDRSD